jgi:hypothetical protein
MRAMSSLVARSAANAARRTSTRSRASISSANSLRGEVLEKRSGDSSHLLGSLMKNVPTPWRTSTRPIVCSPCIASRKDARPTDNCRASSRSGGRRSPTFKLRLTNTRWISAITVSGNDLGRRIAKSPVRRSEILRLCLGFGVVNTSFFAVTICGTGCRFAGEKLCEPGIFLRLLARAPQHRMGSDRQNASQIAWT